MKLHRSEPLHTRDRDRDRARNTQNSAATPNRTAMPHIVAAVPNLPLRAAIHHIDLHQISTGTSDWLYM
jgi:hypothetical protein